MNISMLFASLSAGQSFVLPDGFLYASINPGSSSTFTISNTKGDIPNVTTGTSAAINTSYSFPPLGPFSWAEHTITCVSGSVIITYATGI